MVALAESLDFVLRLKLDKNEVSVKRAFFSTLPFSFRLDLSSRPDRDKLLLLIGCEILGGGVAPIGLKVSVLGNSSTSKRDFPLKNIQKKLINFYKYNLINSNNYVL